MLYAHNDVKLWGAQFKMAAGRAGIPCELFQHADQVPEGARAFVRLDQHADQRAISKNILEALHTRDRGIITLPRRVEGFWYDDKVMQLNILAGHLPPTIVIKDPDTAHGYLDSIVQYPFISKAAEGSSSKAVRLIKDRAQAEAEIHAAFFAGGLPSVYDRKQKNYLYWQKFMPQNECDYRIVIMGRYLMGLVRWNRKDKPFASGSGNHQPILNFDNEKAFLAGKLCVHISREIGTKWMAYDVVFDPDTNKPKVLEMSSSWTPHSYAMCPLFTYDYSNKEGEPMIIQARPDREIVTYGGAMFDCAVLALANMSYGE